MQLKKLEVVMYRSSTGREPVREWLKELVKEDRKQVGEDIKTVQFRWPLGMPLVKHIGSGLWEVRSTLTSHRIARVIFFIYREYIVLLHGFIKKTQKILSDDIHLALTRKKEVERGGESNEQTYWQ